VSDGALPSRALFFPFNDVKAAVTTGEAAANSFQVFSHLRPKRESMPVLWHDPYYSKQTAV